MSLWRNKTADELVGVLVFVFLLSIAVIGTRAALVAGVSDVMSRSAASAQANHDLSFVTPSGVAEGKTVTVTFPVGWSAVGLTADDIDLADNGVQLSTSGSCVGSVEAAAVWTGNTLSLLICPGNGGAIAPGHTINIRIGTNAVNFGLGLNRVTNPATTGNNLITIGGSFGDSGTAPVAITASDQVNVTACVGDSCAFVSGAHSSAGGAPPTPRASPIISNLLVDQISSSMVRVSWQTDQEANSFVLYGLKQPLEAVAGNDALLVDHTLTLSGLSAGQTYNYKIRAVNIFGDIGWSSLMSFTTLSSTDQSTAKITNIRVLSVNGDGAEIAWNTDLPSYWQIELGRSTAYSSLIMDNALSLDHLATLSNLLPNTTYHYRITAITSNGKRVVTGDQTFTTFDTNPPVIFAVSVIETATHHITLAWNTNKAAVCSVKYGTSLSYLSGEAIESVNFATEHLVSLIGLTPSTAYHFEVYCTDQFGNDGKSGDQTAKTIVLTIPPNVSGLKAVAKNSGVILSWVNPTETSLTKIVVRRGNKIFPATINDGELVYAGPGPSIVDANLVNGQVYYYTVFSVNEIGQYSSGAVVAAQPMAKTTVTPPSQMPTNSDNGNTGSVPIFAVPLDGSKKSVAVGSSQMVIFINMVPVPIVAGQVTAMVDNKLTFSLPASLTNKTIDRAYLRIADDTYAIQPNLDNTYSAVSTVPSQAGDYPAAVLINYIDNTSAYAKWNLGVVGAGRVSALSANGDQPLSGAMVTLLDSRGNIWDGISWGQVNPRITGANGEYGFYVPKGRYSIRVDKDGYGSYVEPPREYNGPINTNFQLAKLSLPETMVQKITKSNNLASISDYSIFIVTVILLAWALGYLIFILIKRKKRHSRAYPLK